MSQIRKPRFPEANKTQVSRLQTSARSTIDHKRLRGLVCGGDEEALNMFEQR